MKIDPKKNYKKPLYLLGIASLVGATALCGTGCGDDLQIAGDVPTTTTTELILEGEAQTVETEPVKPSETDEPVVLDGDVTICEPTPTPPVLEGGVSIDDGYYDENGAKVEK